MGVQSREEEMVVMEEKRRMKMTERISIAAIESCAMFRNGSLLLVL